MGKILAKEQGLFLQNTCLLTPSGNVLVRNCPVPYNRHATTMMMTATISMKMQKHPDLPANLNC